jgi:hypothetical protein
VHTPSHIINEWLKKRDEPYKEHRLKPTHTYYRMDFTNLKNKSQVDKPSSYFRSGDARKKGGGTFGSI